MSKARSLPPSASPQDTVRLLIKAGKVKKKRCQSKKRCKKCPVRALKRARKAQAAQSAQDAG